MGFLERTGIIFSVAVIIILFFLIIFAQNGILDYRKLKIKEIEIQAQTRQVTKENRIIESEVKKLKSDLDYIKHVAKHEYDMTEKDEMVFKVKNGGQKGTP